MVRNHTILIATLLMFSVGSIPMEYNFIVYLAVFILFVGGLLQCQHRFRYGMKL